MTQPVDYHRGSYGGRDRVAVTCPTQTVSVGQSRVFDRGRICHAALAGVTQVWPGTPEVELSGQYQSLLN